MNTWTSSTTRMSNIVPSKWLPPSTSTFVIRRRPNSSSSDAIRSSCEFPAHRNTSMPAADQSLARVVRCVASGREKHRHVRRRLHKSTFALKSKRPNRRRFALRFVSHRPHRPVAPSTADYPRTPFGCRRLRHPRDREADARPPAMFRWKSTGCRRFAWPACRRASSPTWRSPTDGPSLPACDTAQAATSHRRSPRRRRTECRPPCSSAIPRPLTCGNGSCMPTTTRFTPARMRACVHGGVFP